MKLLLLLSMFTVVVIRGHQLNHGQMQQKWLFDGPAWWQCGNHESFGSGLATYGTAMLWCGPFNIKRVNGCCIRHDNCYDDQLGQGECDKKFRGCLFDLPCPTAAITWYEALRISSNAQRAYEKAGREKQLREQAHGFFSTKNKTMRALRRTQNKIVVY